MKAARLTHWMFQIGLLAAILAVSDGAQAACAPSDCDDANPCTEDSCIADQCSNPTFVEGRFCGTCNDGIDNDADSDIDAEDSDCSSLAKLQRFGVISQSGKGPLFMGGSTEINSAPGQIEYSTLPYPTGKSVAGVCGKDMKILSGAKAGRFAVVSTRRGISFGQGNTGDYDISVRDTFTSDGAIETLKTRAPFVGPGICSVAAFPCVEPYAPCDDTSAEACCPDNGASCQDRLRLDNPINAYVDRTGGATDFLACLDALANLDAEAAAVDAAAPNVDDYSGCDLALKTSKQSTLIRIPATGSLAAGVQIACISSLKLGVDTTLELHGDPDTYLYLRVMKKMSLGGNSQVVLAGGLKPENVLWYVAGDLSKPLDKGKGGAVALKKGAHLRGAVLAPRSKVKMGGAAVIDGAVYASRVFMNSSSKINHYPFLGSVERTEAADGTITVDVPTTLLTYSSGSGTVTISSAAGAGGQRIFLSSNNPNLANVPTSVVIAAGSTTQSFPLATFSMSGAAQITGFASGFAEDVDTLTVAKRPMSLTPGASLIAPGRSVPATLSLADPAPTGGITVTLDSSANLVATIAPATVSLGEGETAASATINGLQNGSATLRARALGYSDATTTITVSSAATINIPHNFVVGPGQMLTYPISLSSPAPTGGVTVSLQSMSPAVATVSSSAFITAGATTPSTQPKVTGIILGPTQITATASGFAPDTEAVTVQLLATFSPSSVSVPAAGNATTTLSLSSPAPAGGATVNLTTDDPTKATVPPSVFIAPGSASAPVQVSGVSEGMTVLRASGAGIPETTADIAILHTPVITLNAVTVGKELQQLTNGSLEQPAPAGNLQLTLTSADASKLKLSPNATTAGTPSITIQVGAGSSAFSFYVHGLADSGSIQVSAHAAGYIDGTTSVTLVPSGFVFNQTDFTTTSSSANTALSLSAMQLSPELAIVSGGVVRAGISPSVTVLSSDPGVGVITVSPLHFPGNTSTQNTEFDPIAGTSTTLSLVQPPGFSIPTSRTQIVATVIVPAISLSALTIGKDLQTTAYGSLSAPAPAGNLMVTISVAPADSAKLALSTSPTVAGSSSITVQIGAGLSSIPTFYAQALQGTGAAQVTATAPGYVDGTALMSLTPSGFVITPTAGFSTTTFSSNTAINVHACRLDPSTFSCDGWVYGDYDYADYYQPLRAGLTAVSVGVGSSDGDVGLITLSPLTFQSNEDYRATAFQPVGPGISTLAIDTPPGFTTPSNGQEITATVSAPALSLSSLTIGKNLQTSSYVYLGAPAPAGNAYLTLTVSDPAKTRLSLDGMQLGSASVQLTVFAGNSATSPFYIQALEGMGTVTLTATASGYSTGTAIVTLTPSGFVIGSPNDFTTTTFSSNTSIAVHPCRLDPDTLDCNGPPYGYYSEHYQPLRGGLVTAIVNIDSSNASTGTITASPLAFEVSDTVANTEFDPAAAGTSTVSIDTPVGFTTPHNRQQITATVSAPNLYMGPLTIGKNLQASAYVYLEAVAPPEGLTVIVSVSDASRVLLSHLPNMVGAGELTFEIPPGYSYSPAFYVQALEGTGAVTLSAVASGFNTAASTVTLTPSGFAISSPGDFSTTTFSNNTGVTVRPCRLDPITLNCDGIYFSDYYDHYQPLRGGLTGATVNINSTNTGVGTITSGMLFSDAEAELASTEFDPVAQGTTTIAIDTPAGFSTPSNGQSITATVVAPNLSTQATTLGKSLQTPSWVNLEAPAPAGGLTVTVSVSDAAKLLLSDSPTIAGSNELMLVVAPGNYTTPTFYVQGLQDLGSVTVTAVASGYNNASSIVTLTPTGFVFPYYLNNPNVIETTTFSANTPLYVQPCRLDASTLNCDSNGETQTLRGGLAPVGVSVSSSNTTVGTITDSPLTFNSHESFKDTQFDPAAQGTSLITLDTPAGFAMPSNRRQITANVAIPTLALSSLTIGKDLQTTNTVQLQAPAPASGVTVIVSISDSSKALLSDNPASVGSGQVTFNLAPGVSSTPSFYVQALQGTSSVTLSANAVGASYSPTDATVTLTPSGFAIQNIASPSFETSTSSADTSLVLVPVQLDPTHLTYGLQQNLRAGHPTVTINTISSNPAVGTITLPSVPFEPTDSNQPTSFHPVAAGSTVVQVTASGFSTASDHNNITFLVD